MILFLKKYPLFLFLLPLFFVLHGITQNFDWVPTRDALVLTLKYFGVTLLILFLSYLLYKNLIKASLLTFSIMAFNFFFGPIHDFFKSIFGNSFLVRYTFVLPASLILFIIIIIYLKKTKHQFTGIIKYLNWLFFILILIDAGDLLLKSINKKKITSIPQLQGLTDCSNCPKPNIYLIVADEYANSEELKEALHFDNSEFESNLTSRGFHIVRNAKSNYNSTPFSVASLFSMEYINSLGTKFDQKKIDKAYETINENAVINWMKKQGYSIENNSVFRVNNVPNAVSSTFFLSGTDLFTLQTFTGRLYRDLRFNFISRFKIKSEIKKFVQLRLNNNQLLIDKTIAVSKSKNIKPQFVYLHTMMPHFPYLTDKNGIPNYTNSFSDLNHFDTAGYVGYLQYSNKVFLKLIDALRTNDPNAIIIFMGDHGFRHFENNNNQQLHFMSFNSIYLPNKNYSNFYDSMSTVNEFRVLLNTTFNQRLPLLKDSTIYLSNWW